MMELYKEEFEKFSIETFGRRVINSRYFNKPEGEHYKLLAYLSSKLLDGSVVSELGTYQGYEAYALSYNPRVKVISYGIETAVASEMRRLPNVTYVYDTYKNHWGDIMKSSLVFVDLSHTGTEEREILENFKEFFWDGILVFDDIHLNPEMEDFFLKVEDPKYDLTKYGHHSGTGIVSLDSEFKFMGMETEKPVEPDLTFPKNPVEDIPKGPSITFPKNPVEDILNETSIGEISNKLVNASETVVKPVKRLRGNPNRTDE
jgi:hypothetical protein